MATPLVSDAHVLVLMLLRTSFEASVLIVLVLVLRAVMGRRLVPRWRYALWLLVVLRLALPIVPSSPVSIFNLVRTWSLSEDGPAAWSWRSTSSHADVSVRGRVNLSSAPSFSLLESSLLVVWAVGAGVLLARIGVRSYRLAAHLRRQPSVTRGDVLALLENCKHELNLRVPVQVVEAAHITSPAVMGFLRPRLLLPARLLDSFDRDALRMLFLHELAHVKRNDIMVNWLATTVHALHWFNPLAAVAMTRMRADRELATDSLVLCHGRDSGGLYGTTLIRLLDFAAEADPLPGSVIGVLEDKAELKRRVRMIAMHKPSDYRGSAFAIALLVILTATTFTGSIAGDGATTFKGVVFIRGLPQPDGSVENGEFLKGAIVTARNETSGREYVTTTNATGEFNLTATPGRYRFVVGAAGSKADFAAAAERYQPMPLSAGPSGGHGLRYIHAGESWNLQLVYLPLDELKAGTVACKPCVNTMRLDRPSGVLTVGLVDGSGAPLKTATGRVRNEATASEYVVTVPDPWGGDLSAGEFIVNGSPGMYTLTIEAAGMKTLVARTKLEKDGNEPVRLTLDADDKLAAARR